MKPLEVLSAIAIGMSTITLTWQVISWRRSGHVVRVHANQAIAAIGGQAEQLTVVTATNAGRLPVTVTGWGFRLPNQKGLFFTQPYPISEALPCRLEGGSAASWYIPTEEVEKGCAKQGTTYTAIRGFVQLATENKPTRAKRRGIGLRRS